MDARRALREAAGRLATAESGELQNIVDAFERDLHVAAIAYVSELIRASGLNPDVTSGGSVAAFVAGMTPEMGDG